ncbi:MAG TPA: hypothetical protein VFR38_08145 [Gaiellaceae bacterium]|nr:hypothetical protein [Gaiellaceae bacterium]
MNDDELLARQSALQGEAAAFVRELGLIETLGGVGRVIELGSAVTGLMVWRDLDFGVDAPGLTADAAWESLRPVLGLCSSLHYANDRDECRHYFVMQIDDWKVDVSLWFAGAPPMVEAFQAELPSRLTDESRLTILRLTDFWFRLPHYRCELSTSSISSSQHTGCQPPKSRVRRARQTTCSGYRCCQPSRHSGVADPPTRNYRTSTQHSGQKV